MRRVPGSAHPYVYIDRAFSAAAVLAGLGTAVGAWVSQSGIGANYVAAAACTSVLLCGFIGIATREHVQLHQRGEVARLLGARRSGALQDAGATRHEKSPLEGLARAVQVMAGHAFRGLLKRAPLAIWSHDVTIELAARRRQSEGLAARIAEDARLIAKATSGTQRLERELTEQLHQMRGLAEDAGGAGASVAATADQLADAVRAVTAQAENAATIASRLAEAAFSAQQSVASIGVTGNALLKSAAGLESADPQADPAEAGGIHARRASLSAMFEMVRDMNDQCTEAMQKLRALADVVDEQSAFGHALSHAAMAQADAVRRLLSQIVSQQVETGALQQRVKEFRLPETRLGSDVVAQQAVERLPSYAEAMAQLLRGLPEFHQAAANTRDATVSSEASAPQ